MRRFERAAMDLAARNYHVFPCKTRGKAPATANGWRDATRDWAQIGRWWTHKADLNIGVACGPSGVVVLDVDPKHGADPREIQDELELGDPHVLTGEAPPRSADYPDSLEGVRGAHWYFAEQMPTVKNILPGCELRGDTAYVIAPPSVHESGVP
jgi:Bifunctional DNA primase/polymerase, N-terminal